MELPLNPQLNVNDNSKTDESFKQQGTTVNLGSGATYNQNCGNEHSSPKNIALWVSLLCDFVIVVFLLHGFSKMSDRLERFGQDAEKTHNCIEQQSREYMKQAKEGTIWLLRDDINKSIDFYEATKTITQKQYKRLKDEFDYYSSIGGNHDVKDRWDLFCTKIFGLGEIKMVSSQPTSEK